MKDRPLLLILLVALLLILAGLAVQAFEDEVCVSGMIADATSTTIYPMVCY